MPLVEEVGDELLEVASNNPHIYASRMADVLDERTMTLTGNKTAAVFWSSPLSLFHGPLPA